MTEPTGETAALRPLWSLTSGAAAGAFAAVTTSPGAPGWVIASSVAFGVGGLLLAASRGRAAPLALWFVTGLALAGGHGLAQGGDRRRLAGLIAAEEPVWVRARVAVVEGWTQGRWGWRARVEVIDAQHPTERIPSLRRARLEIRGNVRPQSLPRPGSVIRGLVSIRGSPDSPLLVATSGRLIEATEATRTLPTVRDALAHRLLRAADTDVTRIRAAELAAALALGRRDLTPRSRREGWRRSGLAHVLAVSGLHVGLVAGTLWLALAVCGASPTTTRVVILLALPIYALLAGASPSAVRAALMGVIYIGARLLGRALVPMAAVLLTALVLLIADPSMILEVSFQLTVVLTAALVRWAPPLAAWLPLPRWLAAAVAVPVVAQLAAAPLVAVHFASAIPGAAAANLLVPWLLGPTVLTAVGATAVAPVSTTAAGWLLELTDLASRLLWLAGAPGRWVELVPPPLPTALVAVVVGTGFCALLPGRRARTAAAAYVACLALVVGSWLVLPPDRITTVELLPVSHGLALSVGTSGGHLLVDGGGRVREAAELLAPARVRRLAAVIATHGDEDHIGGLETVLRTTTVGSLIIPAWLARSPEVVPLLRTARRRGTRVVRVARGVRLDLGAAVIEVLWPPALHPPAEDNERSLVARLVLDNATVLVTADIGRSTEHRLVALGDIGSSVLIVPHHGSRHSASPLFLDAVAAPVALIPAGPENLHHHPHPEVLERLEERGIEYRMPIRDGRCGARLMDGAWVPYP
jgi:competence protein ComEC